MDNTFTQNVLKVLKEQGLSAVLILILLFFMNDFSDQLSEIKKDIISIKVQLASMNEKYAQKEQVRKMIDESISKHVYTFHGKDLKSNSISH